MSHLTSALHRRSNERRLCEILDIDASSDENHISKVFELISSTCDCLSFMVICARYCSVF